MNQQVERRKYRRFEIPGALAKIGKVQKYLLFRHFSNFFPLINACVGGMNILCPKVFYTGEDRLLELHAPGEKVIRLRSKVIWTNPVPLSKDILIGFELYPFGEGKDLNPPEAMGVLRRLYARYVTS